CLEETSAQTLKTLIAMLLNGCGFMQAPNAAEWGTPASPLSRSYCKIELAEKWRDHSSGGSMFSSSRAVSWFLAIIRAQVFQRRTASSFPAGRTDSALSNQCMAS